MSPRAPQIYAVLLVAEDPLARGGLESLASQDGRLRPVGHIAPDGVEAAVRALSPDAVVWDLGPGARQLLGAPLPLGDSPPTVALLADDRLAGDALAAGVRGVLPREVSGERLAAAVAAVAQGLLAFDESFASALARGRAPSAASEELTPREAEVLQLLAQGLSNKSIAGRLGISDHTAKFHVNSILSKLGAQSRTDAVVRAARLGLLVL